MDDQDNNILYSEALQAARREASDLEQEIAQLSKLLRSLEARKGAVDEVCNALSRWVDLAGGETEAPADPFDGLFENQNAICLSEEEVSLIAYPDGPPED